MRSGLFTVLQIKPTPIGGGALRLDISAEEAKSKEFGFALGYGSYQGAIVGASYRDRNLFGYGRPLTHFSRMVAAWLQGGSALGRPLLLRHGVWFQSQARRAHF